MKVCKNCGRIIEFNPRFNAYICRECGYSEKEQSKYLVNRFYLDKKEEKVTR